MKNPPQVSLRGTGSSLRRRREHRDGTEQDNKTDNQNSAEAHRALGPGLLESAYEECLCKGLTLSSVPFERQKAFPVEYKGTKLNCGYRIDVLKGRHPKKKAKAICLRVL